MKIKLYILVLMTAVLSLLLSSCAEEALGIDDNVIKKTLDDTTDSDPDYFVPVELISWETIVESFPHHITEYPFWFLYTKIIENKVFVDTRGDKPVFRFHFAGENNAPESMLAEYSDRIDRIMKFEIKLDSVSFDQNNRVSAKVDRNNCNVLVRNFKSSKTIRLINRDDIKIFMLLNLDQAGRKLSGVLKMMISPQNNVQTTGIALSFNVKY